MITSADVPAPSRRRGPLEPVEPWSEARLWAAFDAWRWVPPSARHLRTKEYELTVVPGAPELSYVYGFHVPSPARVDAVLDRLREHVTSLGGSGAKVQVTSRTLPRDLGPRLLQRNYEPAAPAEVLSWELRNPDGTVRIPPIGPAEGVQVREARTDAEFDEFHALGVPIFGEPTPPAPTLEAFRRDFWDQLARTGHSGRYLAHLDDRAVGRAGAELVDGVARFWGTGVLESYRRRGIYGRLVEARLRDGAVQGATLALVTARIGTSGPILKRLGFRTLGSVQMYQGRW